MSEKPEKTQETEKGYEIPIPKRGDFMKLLRKVTKGSTTDSPKK